MAGQYPVWQRGSFSPQKKHDSTASGLLTKQLTPTKQIEVRSASGIFGSQFKHQPHPVSHGSFTTTSCSNGRNDGPSHGGPPTTRSIGGLTSHLRRARFAQPHVVQCPVLHTNRPASLSNPLSTKQLIHPDQEVQYGQQKIIPPSSVCPSLSLRIYYGGCISPSIGRDPIRSSDGVENLTRGIRTRSYQALLAQASRPAGSSSSFHINPLIFDSSTSTPTSTQATASTAAMGFRDERPDADRSPSKRPADNIEMTGEAERNEAIDEESDDDLPPAHLDLFDEPTEDVEVPVGPTVQTAPSLSFLSDSSRTFNAYFNIWQRQWPEPESPAAKKRKRPAGGTRPAQKKPTKPKYANYAPKVPTKFTVKPKFQCFSNFKDALFASCDERLPGISEVFHRAWANRTITIMVFVNASATHKASDKQIISSPTNFQSFVHAALTASASTSMGCRIVQEDPRKAMQAMRSLLSASKPSDDESEASDGHESVGSVGGQSSTTRQRLCVGSQGKTGAMVRSQRSHFKPKDQQGNLHGCTIK
ncbi:uncharacterized protein MELLADRAFT_107752 [Melampsora larici-populina 98AG31]|uniref:Uncharacterized protein n=1 Tax=Melampsora larici-populina (strain 98AG31 / pathotype 3-4-7) TaxID=747676 RepID=F4RQU3_MELLP|nr:uncharacterized protein MELLADRAFT_107752 [Melampsora larici-populina 98AG31]EGG05264.1 hypothetical protein MELLADRAFT_107752 [Melampsora larici-populina 98AG31]